MTAATAAAIQWRQQSRGFWRSADGRFDLMHAARDGYWVAIDWERGKKVHGTRLECEGWCEAMLGFGQ